MASRTGNRYAVATRRRAIALRTLGLGYEAVAGIVGCNSSSVRRWEARADRQSGFNIDSIRRAVLDVFCYWARGHLDASASVTVERGVLGFLLEEAAWPEPHAD